MEKKFAIVIATYQRKHNASRQYLTNMFNNLKKQTCKNFKVFIIGDDYKNNEEFVRLTTHPDLDIYRFNNPKSFRTGYFRIPMNKWANGGMMARQIGIKKAKEEGYKYYLHLDDDDTWSSNHIEIIKNHLDKFPQADFIYTRSRYKTGLLPINTAQAVFYNNLLPSPCNTVHSTWCVNLKTLGLTFISEYDKRITTIEKIKNQKIRETELPPFDAHLLGIINKQCRIGRIKSLHITNVTCTKRTDINIPI